MNPEFTALVEPDGVRITDPIERTQFDLHAPSAVSPDVAETDSFYFPIDTAISVRTDSLRTTKGLDVYVRDDAGGMVGQSSGGSELDLPADAYNLELANTQMKVYLAVESEVAISGSTEAVELSFGDETTVEVGARSLHQTPAGTITVPDDVGALMDAVSLLGSALKTTTCERSFPTLRGHPPLLEPGEEFRVEGDLDRPDTGVKIQIPEEREAVYAVAPLAFYLGADVVPGEEPRLLTDEFGHSLDAPDGLEAAVRRVLQQVFFLDCVTRTEGYYEVDLRERRRLEPDVDLDFESLYDEPLAEQLRQYLEIPFEVVEPHLPQWKVTMDVSPSHENLAVLPFAADELAFVRCPDQPDPSVVEPEPSELEAFYRSADDEAAPVSDVIQPDPTDTIEHVWVGDEMPIGASKATPEALKRRLDVTPKHHISVDVVCNDERMREEDVVGDIYGTRDLYNFSVSLHNDLTTGELRDLLESGTDFLHYVGHVTDDGIQCSDGMLDVATLEESGVRGFILNGCRSYQQGETLVEKGSKVGVVTLTKVGNEPATDVGKELARLLNHGFSMQSALSVVTEVNTLDRQYVIVGDGSQELVEAKCGAPLLIKPHREGETIETTFRKFPTINSPLGGLATKKLDGESINYINSTIIQENVNDDSLDEYLKTSTLPVKIQDEIFWSDEITADDI
ncbi:hypothetical protein M0R88_07125 [Halorussus gelatinilyticus]|uniref:CHAT domain-containing protein n=1 Tax=Halorussus gelatinilyticus TaxID=2937524 RepID=A0A8U0IM77_9EURY|nr:hypothetical protein [Halorussus gelatinilyticus]UPW01858.1 hypothetical protein M0R88_07125 [Halorussus gelatinilyticus]